MPLAKPSRMRTRSSNSPAPSKPRRQKPTREAHSRGGSLIDAGQEPPAPGHVAAVLVAEGLDHQRLLAADAQKEQRPEADEAGRPCDPIRQQQRLRQCPQPECRIHRMAHAAIDAARHQSVLLAHLERYRPIAPEILMRPMK